jgi:hypothetical protein
MLIYKPGVNVNKTGPLAPLLKALETISETYGDITITSGNDGKHAKNSYHYHDRAIDIRSRDRRNAELNTLIYAIHRPGTGLKIRVELAPNKLYHWWWNPGLFITGGERGPNQHLHLEVR